jgi:hypothetical protein
MYTRPPPSAPTYSTPAIPPLSILSRSIIQSSAKLFFISHSIGTNDAREWRLVRVASQESMSLYPSCLQDGRFLVKFYISHPADSRYNATNTRFWLQYHTLGELQSPLSTMDTHLIRPSDSSKDYATRHKLLPFRKWVNLTHQDTFIHGPFDFATVTARKLEIVSPNQIGTSSKPIVICSTTHFRALMCHHILYVVDFSTSFLQVAYKFHLVKLARIWYRLHT